MMKTTKTKVATETKMNMRIVDLELAKPKKKAVDVLE